jgi:hypothetical protein
VETDDDNENPTCLTAWKVTPIHDFNIFPAFSTFNYN